MPIDIERRGFRGRLPEGATGVFRLESPDAVRVESHKKGGLRLSRVFDQESLLLPTPKIHVGEKTTRSRPIEIGKGYKARWVSKEEAQSNPVPKLGLIYSFQGDQDRDNKLKQIFG